MIKILIRSVIDFFKDDGPILSGAISCFFMLTVVPFLLLLVSIIGFLLSHSSELYSFFLNLLYTLSPDAAYQITKELESIVFSKQTTIPNLLVYGFFSFQFFVSLEQAVQRVFKTKANRSLALSVLISLLMITLLLAITIISFGVTWLFSLLEHLHKHIPELQMGTAARLLSRFVIPTLLVFLITTSLYMLLPRKKIRLVHALKGALFTSLSFEVSKHLFTFYINVQLSQFGSIYGSLTAIIIFLMWLFFSAGIFLIGAVLVRNLGNDAQGATKSGGPES